MADIHYYNADGSTRSHVVILKDGRALEVNPPTKKTWPSMDAWVQEMPKQWPRVDVWIAATAAATAAAAAESKGPTLHVQPQLAYFLNLPEGATTSSREAIRDALVSYLKYRWCQVSYWTKRDLKPAHPLYHLDYFLVTLTGLDPRGTFTARQILNAVLARQTRAFAAVAPAVEEAPAPVAAALVPPLEETPSVALDEETPSAEDLARHILRIMGENKRLKAEIEALKARLVTIKAACG